MIDDAFVNAFLEEGPKPPGPAPKVEDKPMYTRAEVDKIVQDTIESTMAAMNGQQEENDQGEPEEEMNEGGNENGSSEEGNNGDNE